MRTQFTRKLLGAAIVGLLSMAPVYAAEPVQQETECNSTDTLQGWGIWCGVDTYLAQQEPTAAGPVPGGDNGLGGPAVNGDEFGGKLLPNDQYNWRGYAILRVERDDNGDREPVCFGCSRYTYKTGVLQIEHDPDGGVLNAVMTLDDGSTVTFDQDAEFFAPQWDNSYFVVTSSDESMKLVSSVWPTYWGGSLLPDAMDNEDVTSGYFTMDGDRYPPYHSKFVAGSLTPQSVLDTYRVDNMSATYSGYGMYKGDKDGTRYNSITVNFGDSTWYGRWYLDGFRYGPDNRLEANGVVDGVDFASDPDSLNYRYYRYRRGWRGYDQDAEGTIRGSFNGAEAGSLTGGLDVTIDGDRTVGVFANDMDESWQNKPDFDEK